MNKNAWLISSCLILCCCSRQGGLTPPEFSDDPQTTTVDRIDLPETITAHGIVLDGGQVEVNVEAEDGPALRLGQKAGIQKPGSRREIPCAVSKVRPDANGETGQFLAWLAPSSPLSMPVGEFVSARITIRLKRGVLAIPRGAVLVREGKTFVIRREGQEFKPVPVETGDWSGDLVEIKSGVKAGDEIVSRGATSFIHPGFKAGGEE